MVIECTECHTRFKLADDKVKPGGTKVRCSKCKHIFSVMPPAPEPPPEEEVDFGEFNMERLPEPGSEMVSTPPEESPATADWKEESPVTAPAASSLEQPAPFAFTASDEESASQPAEFSFDGGADEKSEEPTSGLGPLEDFDFGEEPAATGDDRFSLGDENTPSMEESAGGLSPTESFVFGDEETAPGDFALDETGEPAASDDSFSFDGVDEFAFDEDQAGDNLPDEFSFDEEPSAGSVEFDFGEEEADTEDDAGFSWESDSADSGGEGFDFEQSETPAAEADEFDFSGMSFGEDESAPPLPVSNPEQLTQPRPEPTLLAIDEEPLLRKAAPAATSAKAPAEPKVMPLAISSRRKSPLQGVMLFIGLLLLTILGAAIYFYWQGAIPELNQWVDKLTGQTITSQVDGQIRLEGLSSSYLNNSEAGQILVIQGKAVNDFPDARSSLTVKGVIYGKDGKALLQQTVYCGNPLAPDELQNLPYAKIEESMNNPFGESLSNLNVALGKALPFTIVFRNLPANIAEFTVEAVDSKPASKQ